MHVVPDGDRSAEPVPAFGLPFENAQNRRVDRESPWSFLAAAQPMLTDLEVHVPSSQAQGLVAATANQHRSPDRCRLYAVVLRDRCASYRLLSLGLDAERLEVRRSAVVVRRAAVIHWTRAVEIEMVEGTDE